MAIQSRLIYCKYLIVLLLLSQGCGTLPTSAHTTCCPIIELRQYTMLPGKRDFLIDLFDRHFIESQEGAGIALPGQFRVLEDPNRFFWLQGFQSMSERLAAFNRFYHGTAWKTYRRQANTAFLDTDNVLLLHPAHPGSGFVKPSQPRLPFGAVRKSTGIAVMTIYDLSQSPAAFDRVFEEKIRPVVQADGAGAIATFVTDRSRNNFPALPVRTDANVFVWFACFPSSAAHARYEANLAADPKWAEARGELALAGVFIAPEVWQLEPTPRSSIQC